MVVSWILASAIIAGQLIKIPISTLNGISLLDLTVFILCILGLLNLKFKLKKPSLPLIATLTFIFMATLSLMVTPLHLNLGEYLISFMYTLRFSLYILLTWEIHSGAFFTFRGKIPLTFLISGVGLAILGLLQFIFLPDLRFLEIWGWDPHFFRTVSTFLDPNFAGGYFVLTLLLFISLQDTKVTKRSVLWFIIVYLALLTTFSRSSYLMFLVSGTTISFIKKSKVLLFSTILLFILLFAGFQIYTQLVAKPRNIDREQSASFRFNTWQQGFVLFQKSPITGIGYNAYRYGLKEYTLGDNSFLQSHGASSNDSSPLFVLSTTGILGFITYLIFLITLFKKNQILSAAISGLIIHSFFANSLFYPPILIWVLLTSINPKK